MFLAKVVGSVWATKKTDNLKNLKFLVVNPINLKKTPQTDVVIAADILGVDAPMHKYAIQLTVADERDGALSGSTLKEANSWGKVDSGLEQMVFGEATITFPLLASYAYHKGNWKHRKAKELNKAL